MRHTNFVPKLASFYVINDKNEEPRRLFKFDLVDGIQELEFPAVETIGEYYRIKVNTENSDYFLFLLWGDACEILRVGNPPPLVIGYLGQEGQTINYRQISVTDGTQLDQGQFVEIGHGFYYVSPASQDLSFYDIENVGLITLKLPYTCGDTGQGGGGGGVLLADENFFDVGYATFGFQGNKYSYFDMATGQWVQDPTKTRLARASDLAKAVCYRYNLVWNDPSDPNWIRNYIKYMQCFDEERGMFLSYIPSVTPEDNYNNFALIVEDELGKQYIRGIQMRILQGIETIGDSVGIIITYR